MWQRMPRAVITGATGRHPGPASRSNRYIHVMWARTKSAPARHHGAAQPPHRGAALRAAQTGTAHSKQHEEDSKHKHPQLTATLMGTISTNATQAIVFIGQAQRARDAKGTYPDVGSRYRDHAAGRCPGHTARS